MEYTDIVWVKNLLGGSTIMLSGTVGATAVKVGDILIKGGTADVLIPMTAVDQVVVGVATNDAAVGETVIYVPAFPWNVFAIRTATATPYDDSDDKFTVCDVSDFTSGAMEINPEAAVGGDVLLIGLADGETDDTADNIALCIFTDTVWTQELKN